jgi:hypothetical protein
VKFFLKSKDEMLKNTSLYDPKLNKKGGRRDVSNGEKNFKVYFGGKGKEKYI